MEKTLKNQLENRLKERFETKSDLHEIICKRDDEYHIEIGGSKGDTFVLFLYKKGQLKDKAVNVPFDEVDKIIDMFEKGIRKDFY